jgi:hypothetical protein
MRLANDRDQAIIRSAVPDAGSSLVAFLPSLGNREGIAFGEGVPLPTRFRFKDVPAARQPRSQSGDQVRLDAHGEVDLDFIHAVVDRWRESTTTNQRPRTSLMGVDADGMGADMDDGLGAPLIPRRGGQSFANPLQRMSPPLVGGPKPHFAVLGRGNAGRRAAALATRSPVY